MTTLIEVQLLPKGLARCKDRAGWLQLSDYQGLCHVSRCRNPAKFMQQGWHEPLDKSQLDTPATGPWAVPVYLCEAHIQDEAMMAVIEAPTKTMAELCQELLELGGKDEDPR